MTDAPTRREEIARIIAPAAFLPGSERDSLMRNEWKQRVFAKADAILATEGREASVVDEIGVAEREVGQAVYKRIEALMDAKPGTPEGAELVYLADMAESVEEYGAWDGPKVRLGKTDQTREIVRELTGMIKGCADCLEEQIIEREKLPMTSLHWSRAVLNSARAAHTKAKDWLEGE